MRRSAILAVAAAILGLWCAAVRAQPLPPTRGMAENPAPSCTTADADTLATILPRALAQPLMAPPRPLPSDDNAVLVLAGKVEMADPKAIPEFRIFIAPKVVRFTELANGFRERHPISVEQAAEGAPKDSFAIHFTPPRFTRAGDIGLLARKYLLLTRTRSAFVIACDGDRVAAWAAAPVKFSSPDSAHVWAALFVFGIYFCTAFVVFHRRQRLADQEEDDDETKIYRFAKVERWSLLRCLNPVVMTADIFDRGNLPKMQILFFVLLVGYSLAYLAIWRGELSDISPSIVYLLGIPALGTLGAQAVAAARDRLSSPNWAWLVSRRVLPLNNPGSETGPRLSDLVMSDSELDLYKLQAITFSTIVGFSILTTGPTGLAKFAVPDTLLQILGLSQVVFVGGRLAKPTGMGDLDKLISELRDRETVLRQAAATGVDVDEHGKRETNRTAKRIVKPPTDANEAEAIAPMAVKRYRDTAQQAQVMLEAMAHRSVNSDRLLNPKLA